MVLLVRGLRLRRCSGSLGAQQASLYAAGAGGGEGGMPGGMPGGGAPGGGPTVEEVD